MDNRDGRIYESENLKKLLESGQLDFNDKKYIQEMRVHPTPLQRAKMKVGRNDICPCGSGKKFKKCCLGKEKDV